jgi:hypothetical protein
MRVASQKQFWWFVIIFSILLDIILLSLFVARVIEIKVILSRSVWSIVLAIYLIFLIGCVWIANLLRNEKAEVFFRKPGFENVSSPGRFLSGFLFFVFVAAIWYFKLLLRVGVHARNPEQDPELVLLLFSLISWGLALLAAGALKVALRFSWPGAFVVSFLLQTIFFRILGQVPAISDFPFSLGWSEASRYYYASLPFATRLYGMSVPLSILHPTRYFLQSIPFAFGDLPIWVHRLWQVILWVGMTILASWVLAKRLKLTGPGMTILVAGWLFGFLLQGAVYYHLLVCVVIIMVGVVNQNPGRSLVAIVLASFWAGMSRLNWFPVPAMLAIALYLLEQPVGNQGIWAYLRRPILWAAVGVMSAIAGQYLYIRISGNADLQAFGSSLRSDLIWERLLPGSTYTLGVIPGTLLISIPVFLAVLNNLHKLDMHPVRHLGLWSMTAVLFGGGLIVSTKIGGGGDLHNMDAYLILGALIGCYLFFGRESSEHEGQPERAQAWTTIALAVVIPAIFSLAALPIQLSVRYQPAVVEDDLSALHHTVVELSQEGDVLFISERHLLSLKYFRDIRLVPEYETLTLMEMAMSDNRPYLDHFYADLRNHRFSGIVVRKPVLVVKSDEPFAEENNAWVNLVATVLVCEYQPILTLDSVDVQVYVPNQAAVNCLPGQ